MDLRQVLAGAVSEARARSPERPLEVSVELPQGPVVVNADPMLKDAFMNLFSAAARSARRKEARLSVTGQCIKEAGRDMWLVKVADPERAIPDPLKTEVLMMTKKSRSALAGGFGIGLAAAKSIVERYGGKMWVSDIAPRDPSKGCVFNILLPKAD